MMSSQSEDEQQGVRERHGTPFGKRALSDTRLNTMSNSSPLRKSTMEEEPLVIEEHQHLCRVCRGPSAPESPLFHPCKCSGTIRYVHQECLLQWLQHSRQRACELCKHEFSFENLYAQEPPASLPFLLYLKGLAKYSFRFTAKIFNILFLCAAWILLLPISTSLLMRFMTPTSIILAFSLGFDSLPRMLYWVLLWLQGWSMLFFAVAACLSLYRFHEFLQSSEIIKDLTKNEEEIEAANASGAGVVVEGITAREYRAYLLRQRLHRQQQQNADNSDDGASVDTESQRSTTVNRDIRCRICSSRTCISMDHLRQAAFRQRPAPNEQANVPDNISESTNEDETIDGFFNGGVRAVLRNVAVLVLLATVFFIHVIHVPYVLGLCLYNQRTLKLLRLTVKLSLDYVKQTAKVLFGVSPTLPRQLYRGIFKAKFLLKRLDTTEPYSSVLKLHLTRLLLGYCVVMAVFRIISYFVIRSHRSQNKQISAKTLYYAPVFVHLFFHFSFFLAQAALFVPIVLGHLVDFLFLPIIDGTVWSRCSFIVSYPLSALCIHWLTGMLMIFILSVTFKSLYKVVRSGLLRSLPYSSPDGSQSDKLKRIFSLSIPRLNLIVFAQLTKLGVLFSLILGVFCKFVVPGLFKKSFNISLADYSVTQFPIDLLVQTFLQEFFFLIYPNPVLSVIGLFVQRLSRLLCLSSFLRGGGRYPLEESPAGHWEWSPSVDRKLTKEEELELEERPIEPIDIARLPIVEGSNPALGTAVSNSVSATPETVRQRRRRITGSQPTPQSNIAVLVYKPPHFLLRMTVLVGFLWVVLQALLAIMIPVPVLMGRALALRFLGHPLHEMHHWKLGAFVLFVGLRVFSLLLRLRNLPINPMQLLTVPLKAVFLVFHVFILWPVVYGALIFILAVRWTNSTSESLHVRLPTILWVFGMPSLRVYHALLTLNLFPIRLIPILASLTTPTFYLNYDFREVLTQLVLPLNLLSIGLIFGPPFVTLLIGSLLKVSLEDIRRVQAFSLHILLLLIATFLLIRYLWRSNRALRERIWSETYVRESRLRNLD